CLAGNGESPAKVSWRAFRIASGGLRGWLSVGGSLLLLRLSALGMAANVLYRRLTCFARHLCSPSSQRVGGLEKDPSRELGRTWSRNSLKLETVSLPGAAYDEDE